MLSRRILGFISNTFKAQIRTFASIKNMEKEEVVPDVISSAPKGEKQLVKHVKFS